MGKSITKKHSKKHESTILVGIFWGSMRAQRGRPHSVCLCLCFKVGHALCACHRGGCNSIGFGSFTPAANKSKEGLTINALSIIDSLNTRYILLISPLPFTVTDAGAFLLNSNLMHELHSILSKLF